MDSVSSEFVPLLQAAGPPVQLEPVDLSVKAPHSPAVVLQVPRYSPQLPTNGADLRLAYPGKFLLLLLKPHFICKLYIYIQHIYAYIHSANWCENWVLGLGEGQSLVPFRSY
jgi:hypothetical protein